LRRKLERLGNAKRYTFVATVTRFGTKSFDAYISPTMLLTELRLDGEEGILTDHLWQPLGKQFIDVREGDVVRFHARVNWYVTPRKMDCKLTNPTKVEIIGHDANARDTTLAKENVYTLEGKLQSWREAIKYFKRSSTYSSYKNLIEALELRVKTTKL